ncbi:LD-carboxypeptidase [Clostridium sp. D2Q-14]|uniref:S66 peptidase family protein n=1 Tax=Anaeromonas gelatinilytica TaxID=2683194 RepID=UPI00193B7FA7|nr:LD-carboxypeptidase [Anaeromonas gelatinilytica]MBS4534840.1 LD-carboxypeptidase [Anaeromonas gelatinilytica]
MIKPRMLKKGSTIGLVAPASDAPKGNVNKSIKYLKSIGFKVKVGESCYSKKGFLAGKDVLRAKNINEMFVDKSVDAVFCIRGGYGVHRILDKIDYNLIKENPKIFMGYSDITALHIAINKICDLITFHGPMTVSDMKDGLDELSLQYLKKIIMTSNDLIEVNNPKENKIKTLVKGKVEGEIIGGNLALVSATIGTPYEIDTDDKIFFIEDIGEYTFSIDRMLMQLKLAGKLDNLRGIVLGDFNNCIPQDKNDHTLIEVFQDILVPLNIPIIYNLKSGHCTPNIVLPLGGKVEIDGYRGKLFIKGSVVINE